MTDIVDKTTIVMLKERNDKLEAENKRLKKKYDKLKKYEKLLHATMKAGGLD